VSSSQGAIKETPTGPRICWVETVLLCTFANEEALMTDTANHSVREQGNFGRALAAVGAFVQSLTTYSLDYTLDRIVGRALSAVCAFLRALEAISFDHTTDRIDGLEPEVGRPKEELRQSRDPGAVPRNHVRRSL